MIIKYLRYKKWYKAIKESGLFDTKYYLFTYPDVRKIGLEPIKHYLKFGADEGRNPSKEFNTSYYLEANPDVREMSVNPLAHYVLYGKAEGRMASVNSVNVNDEIIVQETKNKFVQNIISKVSYVKKAKKEYTPIRRTIIIVSHESSATGAPLLGLNIGKSLSESFNIIHYVIRKDSIHKEFYEDAVVVVEDVPVNSTEAMRTVLENIHKKYNIYCVLCNSVVTYPVLTQAYRLQLPILSLIHEFAEYTKPKDKMLNTILYANKVILPATIIQDSILDQISKEFHIKSKPINIEICPQGKLPYLVKTYGNNDDEVTLLKKLNITAEHKENIAIIVASGYAQIRKGLDLFLYTARYIKQIYKKECRFVWVGDGFDPERDFAYSLWIEREIRYLNLEDDFIFLEHQQDLKNIFALADIFFLSSRMDPFPNVVVDAMEVNLPIACFDNASGSVEFLRDNNADAIIGNYLDTYDLANKISSYLQNNSKTDIKNRELVKEKLDFSNYVDFLHEKIDESYEKQTQIKNIYIELENSKLFDFEYYGYMQNKIDALYHYINCRMKGLSGFYNPKIGFSDTLWLMQNKQQNVVPLYEAIKKNETTTHKCSLLEDNKASSFSHRYAVHLHLYYTELTNEFAKYFKHLPKGFDLYISVVDDSKNDAVRKVFKHNSKADNIIIKKVNNIGRDIGPMLFEFQEELLSQDYEIIGHFHSKKSTSTDANMGNRWRTYLLENLIGDKERVSRLLALFEDKKLGLVFAEDRHAVDIGENKQYVNELAQMLGIKEKIDNTPIFPLGNMFWARRDAIKEMFHLEKVILQEEPLPYDGTFMHALERITPNLVEKNGYKWITVYKKGSKW